MILEIPPISVYSEIRRVNVILEIPPISVDSVIRKVNVILEIPPISVDSVDRYFKLGSWTIRVKVKSLLLFYQLDRESNSLTVHLALKCGHR